MNWICHLRVEDLRILIVISRSFEELCKLPGGTELLNFGADSDGSSAPYSAKRQDHPAVVPYYNIRFMIFMHKSPVGPVLQLKSSLKTDTSNICQRGCPERKRSVENYAKA